VAALRLPAGGLIRPVVGPAVRLGSWEFLMSESEVAIFVCVSCRRPVEGRDAREDDLPGPPLVAALQARLAGEISVVPVECLAVCKRPCTLVLAGSSRWTYLIGDLDSDRDLEEIVEAARSYAASGNGILPWRERPASFRQGVIARVPPRATAAANPAAPEGLPS